RGRYSTLASSTPSRCPSSSEQAPDEAVEDVGLAHQALVVLEVAHDGDEDGRAAHDHVGASLLEPGVVHPHRAWLGGEGAEHLLRRPAGEREVMDAVAVVFA